MNLNIKSKIVLGSSFALILIIVLSLIAYRSIGSLVETSEWVDHTHLVLENASTIEKLIVDMETGERGFLIAGKEEFLEPYESGKKQLSSILTITNDLVSDNPKQVERLADIEKTIKLWQKKAGVPEIKKRRDVAKNSNAITEFKNLYSRTVGKEIFDNIRYEFQTIRSEFELENNLPGVIVSIDTLKSLVDIETGQRGFLLTGKEESLDPFITGQKSFEQNLKFLKLIGKKSKSNRIIDLSIDRILIFVNKWFDKAVTPEIESRRKLNKLSSTMTDVTSIIERGVGKRIMDDIRFKLKAFKQVEQELMTIRKIKSKREIMATKNVIIFGTLIILIASLIWSFWHGSNISNPINQLKLASDGIRDGNYPGKIYIKTKDEIADLGNAFEKMAIKIKSDEQAILLKIKEAESAKEEAEEARLTADSANKAKSVFLANMSHEKRTPLNAIIGYSQILQRKQSLIEEQFKAIQTINKSGNHLLELINNILDISKIEAGKEELNAIDFDLGALSNELISIFSASCQDKQIALDIDKQPEGQFILNGDLGKLRQVLMN
jgi:methyl-accepting chemotaxis protein